MLKYSALAALGLVAATPAFAADPPNLTGGHVEAIAGWDHTRVKGFGHDDGVVFGVGAGYDFTLMGDTILGVEGEVSTSTADACSGCISDKYDLYAGLRVGTEIAPGDLLYLKAGYTNVKFNNFHVDGIRVGGGWEHRFQNNMFVKGEYRYSNYESGGSRHQLVAGVGLRF